MSSAQEAFDSPHAVAEALAAASYLPDDEIAMAVFLAQQLNKPLLVEGPAGTGKTELAKAVARMHGLRLLRLQCYEGLDESKALYEWDYKRQLLRIQAARSVDGATWQDTRTDMFDEEFLLARPLLEAIRSEERVVLLIDEVDRIEVETEALLLEVLSEYQVSIPELGTIKARHVPLVFLTSNNTRDLSEALKRRCLFLPLRYPTVERERQIVRQHVPGINEQMAVAVAKAVAQLRTLDLRKQPSVSETIDWARMLVTLGTTEVTASEITAGFPVLLKHESDIATASRHFLSVD